MKDGQIQDISTDIESSGVEDDPFKKGKGKN